MKHGHVNIKYKLVLCFCESQQRLVVLLILCRGCHRGAEEDSSLGRQASSSDVSKKRDVLIFTGKQSESVALPFKMKTRYRIARPHAA